MTSLAAQWDALLADEPPDWSHLFLELRVDDTEQMEQTTLLMCPVNPWHGETWRTGWIRFRVARTEGYGADPGVVRACLARLDGAGVGGRIELLDDLDAVHTAGTQGPV